MNIKQQKIEKLDNHGRGITYYDGKIMFVKGALPDEIVDVTSITDKKKYYEGRISKINVSSPKRVIAKCPYYEECGGCNIMHMNYESQLKFKVEKVKEILKRYGNIETEVKLVENDKQLFYRNKVTLKVKDYQFGLYEESSHKLKPIDNCLIISQAINDIIKNNNFLKLKEGEVTIRSNNLKDILIIINSSAKLIIDNEKIPSNVKGIVHNNIAIYKDDFFYDTIDNLHFKISYDSFFQVNNYMAGRIFNILRGNLEGENILDLYCGVGTLGQSISDNFKNIYGVEINENAILNAKDNAKLNGIKNALYYCGNSSLYIESLNVNFDTIIVDPPRSGLNNSTIEQIINIRPKNVAYISCDPITFARDLKILKEYYDITKVNVLDMFPNTYHTECLTVLTLKEN